MGGIYNYPKMLLTTEDVSELRILTIQTILFYSGSPEIHRLFDDAFVWFGWDRSIALIDMDQYGQSCLYGVLSVLCT